MKENAQRLRRYAAKTDGSVAGRRFDDVKIVSRDLYASYARFQATAEAAVKVLCSDVSVVLLPRYMNYALELCSKTSDRERQVVYTKWHTRGLTGRYLRAISSALRSWLPAPDVMDVLGTSSITTVLASLNPGAGGYASVWNRTTGTGFGPAGYIQSYQAKSGSTYFIGRALFFFDTSPLGPGSTVVGATLRVLTRIKDAGFTHSVVIRSGLSGVPHVPPVTADYNRVNHDGNYGSAPASAFTAGSWTDIPLTSAGLFIVNPLGVSKLILIGDDDLTGTAPTANNVLVFWRASGDASKHPHLLVYYYPD